MARVPVSRQVLLVLVTVFASGSTLPVFAQAFDQPPEYREFRRAIFLPYLNAEGGLGGHTPALGISFGGSIHQGTMDSGSTGVVVAASMIPNFRDLPSLGEGRLTYTSSGRVMIGQWVTTRMTLHGAGDTRASTDAMPVLGVTRVECLRQARDCQPDNAPSRIAMIGIGFAREHDAQTQSTPDKNPFLHLDPEGLPYRRGYVLTDRGVHIGLTNASTRGEFHYWKLRHNDALGDWFPVPACIRISGRAPAACGSMLMDTGLTTMFLTVPAQQVAPGQREISDGTEISIDLGTAAATTPLYAFRAGDAASRTAPAKILLRVGDDPPFVNTSVHFLGAFDYLYDFDGGYVAFRRRP